MKLNLFEPVDYSSKEESSSASTEKLDPEAVNTEMKLFHTEVNRLIEGIVRGYSDLHAPIQIRGSPLPVVIDRMSFAPNKENLTAFFEIALQDLGARFTKACKDIFNDGRFPNLNKVIK